MRTIRSTHQAYEAWALLLVVAWLVAAPYRLTSRLTPSDATTPRGYGRAIAVSNDTAVVSAWFEKIGDNDYQGAVYVFAKPNAGWSDMTQTAKLTASDGAADDLFGAAVAISGDTIVVGVPGKRAAYVYVKPASGWANMTETAKLTPTGGQYDDGFGVSLAIDGDTVVVGARNEDLGGILYDQGAAYVYVRPVGGWADMTQTARLTASDPRGYCRFGVSVAISGDTLVIGAHQCVAAYVFVKPAAGWADMNQTARLDSSSAIYDYFGYAVAIDGDVAAIGAVWDDVNGNSQQGSAYIFVKPGGGWVNATETAKLTASDGGYKQMLGGAVAMDGDAVVSAGGGAAYIFAKPAGGWAGELHERSQATCSAELTTVAIHGETVAVAAYDHDHGSAYVFEPGWVVYLPLVVSSR